MQEFTKDFGEWCVFTSSLSTSGDFQVSIAIGRTVAAYGFYVVYAEKLFVSAALLDIGDAPLEEMENAIKEHIENVRAVKLRAAQRESELTEEFYKRQRNRIHDRGGTGMNEKVKQGMSLKHHSMPIAGQAAWEGGSVEICEDSPDWRIILRGRSGDVIDTMRIPPECLPFLRKSTEMAEIGHLGDLCIKEIQAKAENRRKSL